MLQAKSVQLFASTNKKYPSSAGWLTLVRHDGEMGFARLTGSEDELQVVMLRGNNELTATVTKVETETGPEIPAEGIMLRPLSYFLK